MPFQHILFQCVLENHFGIVNLFYVEIKPKKFDLQIELSGSNQYLLQVTVPELAQVVANFWLGTFGWELLVRNFQLGTFVQNYFSSRFQRCGSPTPHKWCQIICNKKQLYFLPWRSFLFLFLLFFLNKMKKSLYRFAPCNCIKLSKACSNNI